MRKELGKYYNGPKWRSFITDYEVLKVYDECWQKYLDVAIIYGADGSQDWRIISGYRDKIKDLEYKIDYEKQLLELMKEQLKYIDVEKLRGKAIEEYEKSMFFINHESELNLILREQAKEEFGIDDSILPDQLIAINQLDSYSLEDLQAILDGTYGREFNNHIK